MRHSIFLFALLLLAQAPSTGKPRGYSLGSCGSEDFTVQHVSYSKGKVVSFDYFMPADGVVDKVEPPIDFQVKSEKVMDNGDLVLTSEAQLATGHLTYNAIVRGKYQVGVVLNSRGYPSHVLYGAEGEVDGMTKLAAEYYKSCKDFRNAETADELPGRLHEWLEGRQPQEKKETQ